MTLGDLERQVMDIFWDGDGATLTVRDVAAFFPDHAYTTIMTVLSRLAGKGFLLESKDGRLNTFRPAASREDYITSLLLSALASTDDRHAVLTAFAAAIDPKDRRFLRGLFTRKSR